MSRRRCRISAAVPVLAATLAVLAAAGAARGAEAGPVRVHVDPADLAPLAAVRERIASVSWLEPAGAGAPTDLRVTAEEGAFALRTGDGQVLAPSVPAVGPDAGRRLADAVVAAAHRAWMYGLDHPGSDLRVAFRLEREEGPTSPEGLGVVEPGAKLRWEAENLSDRPIHVSVFDVSPDGGVTLLHPHRGPGERLDPGDTTDQTVTMLLPDDWEQAPDVFTLIATAVPLDPRGFLAPDALVATRERLEATDWQVFRRRVVVRRELAVAPATASVEPAEPAGPSDGTVASEPRSGPRKLSFAVHFATDVDVGRVRHRVAKLRALCGRNGSACDVLRVGPGAFELERTGRRLGEAAQLTVGSAFEQAYEIRTGLEALRVEPLLELVRPAGREAPGPALTWAALRRAGGASGTALPLFEGLHPQGTPTARAVEGYRRLFGLAPDEDLARVAFFEAELLHHYALDADVARTLDALAAPGGGAAAAAEARVALLRRGLSAPLREALADAGVRRRPSPSG